MSSYRNYCLSIIFIVLLPIKAVNADQFVGLVGNTSIAIPLPSGFVKANREIESFYSKLFSNSDARFIAAFVPAQESQTEVMYYATTIREYEKLSISDKKFAPVRNYMRANFDGLISLINADKSTYIERANAAIKQHNESSRFRIDSRLINGQEAIGIFIDKNNALGWLSILHFSNSEKNTPQAYASVIALVKGKIVYFYNYKDMHSASDLIDVKNDSILWLEKISQANK